MKLSCAFPAIMRYNEMTQGSPAVVAGNATSQAQTHYFPRSFLAQVKWR